MTEIEDFVLLILPEFRAFIKDKNIEEIMQKGLDNNKKTSIHCDMEEIEDDPRY